MAENVLADLEAGAARRWVRVRMTELQWAQLEQLRRELGQDPPPGADRDNSKIAA
jgi:hypothetical protein